MNYTTMGNSVPNDTTVVLIEPGEKEKVSLWDKLTFLSAYMLGQDAN